MPMSGATWAKMPSGCCRSSHIVTSQRVKNGCHVEVVGGRADEELGVARPAQPLVALRAVGGHLQIVALLAPDDVVLKLVDQRAGALELARAVAWSVCTTMPVTASQGRLFRQAAHLHVAEAVEGEARFEVLDRPCRPEYRSRWPWRRADWRCTSCRRD